jgi:hypothetical protein
MTRKWLSWEALLVFIDADSCRHAFDDGLASLFEHEARGRAEEAALPRRHDGPEGNPSAVFSCRGPALLRAVEAWKLAAGLLLCAVAALTFCLLWIGRGR